MANFTKASPSSSLAAKQPASGIILAALLLAGCAEPPSFLDEARQYHWRQEAAQLRAYNWPLVTQRVTGLNPQPLISRQPPAYNGYGGKACQYLPTEQRRTTQSGVADDMTYTQCWQTPYYNSGQRLQGRPK